MTEEQNISKPDGSRPGASRRWRALGWTGLALGLVLAGLVALGSALMIGRTIDAPVWLRDRIAAQIGRTVPGLVVDFGQMSLRIERTGLARVILWDVALRNAQGERIAELADIEAGFAPLPLLRGETVLRHAQISGVLLTLRRDAQGAFGLALGDAFSGDTVAPGVSQIIAQIDRLAADPRFAGLTGLDADAVTIRYEDARAGRGWTADGGRLRLSRSDGVLRLGGDAALLSGSGVATLEINAESPIGDTRAEFGLVLSGLASGDIATQSPALAWLGALDAPISGALRSGLARDGSLARLNATLQIGKGALRPTAGARPVPFDSARAYFTFDPADGLLQFNDISVTSPLLSATAEGRMRLAGLDAGWPEAIEGQMRLSRFMMPAGGFLASDLEIAGAEADFKLDLSSFAVTFGRLRVTDPAFPLRARGYVAATATGWDISLDGRVERTTPGQVLSFWPDDLQPKARKWVADNVHSGTLHEASVALRFHPGQPPLSHVSFRFDEAHVSYNPRLPPITGAAGHLTLDGAHLGLRLDRGRIAPGQGGALDVAGSEFTIADLRAKPATGVVRLAARGSLTAALAYADNDAWRVLRRVGRDPSLATGLASLSGRIALPLRPGLQLDDIEIALAGSLSDLSSDAIVPGRSLRAEALEVALDNKVIEVKGPVTLSGVLAEGRWLQPLKAGTGRVTARVTLDDPALRAFGVRLPEGMLGGRGPADLVIDLPPGQAPAFALSSSLSGLSLDIPQLGWRLSGAETGAFRIGGRLGAPLRIEGISLDAGGLQAEGDVRLTANGALAALELSRLRVRDWMDVSARLIPGGSGSGAAPRIEIASGAVDVRRLPGASALEGGGSGAGGGGAGGAGGGAAGAPAAALRLALDRLTVTEGIALTDFRGEFAAGRGMDGRFTARINGAAPIEGRVIPQAGRLGFRIDGEDAGEVLKAARLFRTVQNGTFRLDLAPVRGAPGQFDGQMTIRGARLRNAPAIGALLDAVSIVGLLDQLNGPGIFFSEVEALFRLSPDRVVLNRSSAIGPSMGISMDGYYETATGRMDMQGVISPIYILNGIGRLISRKGEGLIGFNFNLRGSMDAPRVAVNPLSVFTPGMFRDIFRRPPPDPSR